ncbi:MAG: hypothetical protein RMJ66_04450 [Bacteroidia bacterium]|nr:hypothetical protein [Bacteroidia bacterium]MDW8134297.1 hypothetical protein [Bacteroidia bacterium]
MLEHLLGIWEGPVISTTVIGDFPTWKVDFRPISSNQISARNELDSANNIHMSFFVVRYEGRDLLCMRNGGFFSGIERLTYLFLDSASQGYYRFVEPISKGQRAYVEIVMRGPDSLILSAYTNKFRSRPSPVLHMRWTARRLDTSAAFVVARSLRFPSKVPVRDFTTFLRGREEAIFYSPIANDPYPHTEQPYLSTLHARYRHGTSYIPSSDRNVILFTTLMPLVEGLQYKPENLRYITRYVRIPASKDGFIFWHIHPGRYYLYALYDADGNGMPSSGDWFSLYGQEVNIPPETSIQAEVQINFQIP